VGHRLEYQLNQEENPNKQNKLKNNKKKNKKRKNNQKKNNNLSQLKKKIWD
jgi:hypothetical protein